MYKLNIHEAKTHLSHYLEKVERGETVILCRRNEPIAQIQPLSKTQPTRRRIGTMKGRFKLTPAFFEPLPDDIIQSFEGEPE